MNRYTLRGIDYAFLARLDEVQEELLYYPWHGVRVGVGVGVSNMLKFYVKVYKITYDERYWSKILFSTIPTPGHDLQIKVTDLEILC